MYEYYTVKSRSHFQEHTANLEDLLSAKNARKMNIQVRLLPYTKYFIMN